MIQNAFVKGSYLGVDSGIEIDAVSQDTLLGAGEVGFGYIYIHKCKTKLCIWYHVVGLLVQSSQVIDIGPVAVTENRLLYKMYKCQVG